MHKNPFDIPKALPHSEKVHCRIKNTESHLKAQGKKTVG